MKAYSAWAVAVLLCLADTGNARVGAKAPTPEERQGVSAAPPRAGGEAGPSGDGQLPEPGGSGGAPPAGAARKNEKGAAGIRKPGDWGTTRGATGDMGTRAPSTTTSLAPRH